MFIEDGFSNFTKVVNERESNDIFAIVRWMDGEIEYIKLELLADDRWIKNLRLQKF